MTDTNKEAVTETTEKEFGEPQIQVPLERLEFTQLSLNRAWETMYKAFLTELDVTPTEKQDANLREIMAKLHNPTTTAILAGIDLSDKFDHWVMGQREIPLAVVFDINNDITRLRNNSHALPAAALNKFGVGSDDPRWVYGPLPEDRIISGSVERIPMRAETTGALLYGYLELFTEQLKRPDGTPYEQLTNIVAFRCKNNYILPASIWRWFEVTDKDVKAAWNEGRSKVVK